MTDIIRLLPDAIANQIAAGEVVQRPASVVKELLENSVDAKSTSIQLIIREAGKSLVQVIDDGMGMSETDARMSFERHATSKIRTSDDLFSIRTLGFRGEALASIAAVAQVELRTRRSSDELGSLIRVEASQIKVQEATASLPGTNLSVKNLFFNVPARRNFLRSNAVEMRHVLDEFQRVALANPEISFALYHNDAEVYNLPAGKLSHRIVSIFGKNYREQLAPCQEETPFVKVTGYIGKPEFARKTRGEQFFFVNNRYVRHNYLHHAVMSAFEGLLPDDSYPFYVLFIEIDPVHIDINVHPTKTEIKFDDERSVYAIVLASVRKALGSHNIAPSLDFGFNVNFPTLDTKPIFDNGFSSEGSSDSNSYEKTPREKSNLQNWTALYQEFQRSFPKEQIPEETPETVVRQSLTFESKVNVTPADSPVPEPVETERVMPVFQLHNRFIITQVKSGMMLIDQQAAHERILYDKFKANLHEAKGISQQSLFPVTIDLNPSDFQLLMEIQEEVSQLGFVLRVLGKNTVVVEGIPAEAALGREKELIEGLIEQFKWNQAQINLNPKENIARSMARRSAMKRGIRLSHEEMSKLVEKLFASSNPNYAPDGSPTLTVLNLEKINSFFIK
ncbi:DNA mismatch repair endonuclease MutL [Rhodocytophaga rosea]|uniref:DNA mismatch repair protein MutL n=1 Tax=Rhodocytophaga rosea TaxID=2704465 RepID=A0A6C0GJK1_9BACT|nr:DNA mismatch repair endonuclease MutL [Rhodocytophaga rosea]QHT67810.1 DNA mismatch repair endonuclease MutL [Rhodocytophaga rosea]